MKKRNQKRGFTVVELVVVVTVIAILSAVLIPTFAGIINRSRETSDQSAVRNMNTILAADGAVEPTNIVDLFDVLLENGIEAENYKPLYKDRFFFWDSNANQVVYAEYTADGLYTAIYPESREGDTSTNKWYSLSGEVKKASLREVEDTLSADKKTATVTSVEQLTGLVAAIADGKNAVEDVTAIELPAKLNLMGADIMIENGDSKKPVPEFTFKGAAGDGTEITGMVIDRASREGVGTTKTERKYYAGMIAYAKNVRFENITIKDTVIGSDEASLVGAFVGSLSGKAEFVNCDLENVTVRGLQKVGSFVGYLSNANSKVIIDENCDATNVTVEVTAGAAGGIVGFIGNGLTTAAKELDAAGQADFIAKKLEVKGDLTRFDDVKLVVNKVPTGYYITDTAGKVYGLDLNDDLSPASTFSYKDANKTEVDTGFYRYYETTAKYAFVQGAYDYAGRPATDFTTPLYKNGERMIVANGLTHWGE